MNLKILQLQKRASYEYKYIQDRYHYSLANGCIALSDGTTQSFKSELWAEMIVENFIENPSFEATILKNNFKNIAKKFNEIPFEYSSNFAMAALQKEKLKNGGTGTFFGMQYVNKETIQVINCGDTCLFILRNDKIIPFPFKSLEELDQNNYFINSSKLLEDEVEDNFFNSAIVKVEKNDVIFVATDALSRLIFRKPEILNEIINIDSFEELKLFCLENWENRELEEDDISVFLISPFQVDSVREIIPPEDFSFTKPQEVKFVPSTGSEIFNNDIDPIKMEQINRMIQNLFKETDFLKKKLKLTQVLLSSALILLFVNTVVLLYFFYAVNVKKSNQETSRALPPQVEVRKNAKSRIKINIQSVKEVKAATINNSLDDKEEVNREKKAVNTTSFEGPEERTEKELNNQKSSQKVFKE